MVPAVSIEALCGVLSVALSLPAGPAALAGGDHHEPSVIAVAGVVSGIPSEKLARPLEVRVGNTLEPGPR